MESMREAQGKFPQPLIGLRETAKYLPIRASRNNPGLGSWAGFGSPVTSRIKLLGRLQLAVYPLREFAPPHIARSRQVRDFAKNFYSQGTVR
jgi:hypothetical protein